MPRSRLSVAPLKPAPASETRNATASATSSELGGRPPVGVADHAADPLVVEERPGGVGLDEPEDQGVRADAGVGVVDGHLAGEPAHRGLARGVARLAAPGHEALHRRHGHERPARGTHGRDPVLEHPEHAVHVGPHEVVEVVGRQVHHGWSRVSMSVAAALLTTAAGAPRRSCTSANSDSTSASSDRSRRMNTASLPAAVIAATVFSPRSTLRPTTATRAPSDGEVGRGDLADPARRAGDDDHSTCQ